MKNSLLGFLLLFTHPLFAQTAYQPSDVDSVAVPRGGAELFNTFIQATLRKPIQAEAEGIGGQVSVSGTVETDGRISDVRVTQSFRPDCDREAVRVFSLFNAWKPAQRNGQPVRQRMTTFITFPPNTPFTYTNGNRIDYYSSDNKFVADSSQAIYKRVSPTDTNGLPTGDIVEYEIKEAIWKEYLRLPFVDQKNDNFSYSDKLLHSVGNQNSKQQWEGKVFALNPIGAIVRISSYKHGKRTGLTLRYHPNGSVTEKTEIMGEKTAIMSWYMNGQIREIKEDYVPRTVGKNDFERVTALWDSTGYQKVKDGNGRAVDQSRVRSKRDTTKYTLYIRQWAYENGFKNGVWTGRYMDSSYFYLDKYDKGSFLGGKEWHTGSDTVRYSVYEQQPEYEGGMVAFGRFLTKNLKYPRIASRAGVQGRVFVNFIINVDGSVSDVYALKGIGYGCDEEAVRVVKASNGNWKAGLQRGRPVRVKYNLPIIFGLN
ncbi:TonB family protein [Spirosoma jeollabukense]